MRGEDREARPGTQSSYLPGDTEFDRLRLENRELEDRLKFLTDRYRSLEERVHRLESSILFRFLRWLGPQLVRLHVLAPELATGQRSAESEEKEYAAWVEEADLLDRVSAPEPSQLSPEKVTVVVDSRGSREDCAKRMLNSLENHGHRNWELLIITEGGPPGWISSASGRRTEVVAMPDLSRCSGEFLFLLHPHAVLHPRAFENFLYAAEEQRDAAVVYSDWDHITPGGRRYGPRFTPEFSPELLEQTLYWGACFLARTEAVRAEGWVSDVHGLARRLARRTNKIRRIPKVLWHLQDVPASPAASEGPLPSPDAGASIVICTRHPKRLNESLKAIKLTLAAGHEIVVVAHCPSGDFGGIDEAASKWGARVVRYEGPFHFGEMNRIGVEASENEVVVLLNDDVFPLAPGWLERMLAQAVRPEVGIVGALLLYPDRSIQHAGIVVGQRLHPAHIGRGVKQSALWPWLRMTREVTAVTGACMAFRRTVWDELGGFDPQFPVNYNDVDLCLRGGQRGYRVILEARAVLIHKEAQTRIPVVRPEETERFHQIWRHVIEQPDHYFNPQLDRFDDSIRLPRPWTLLR